MKQLSSQQIYNGVIINVVRDEVLLEDGTRTSREVVKHRDAVAVAAVDNDGNLLVVRQHRYAVGRELIELPAGLIDSGETPLEAAKRELKEETGYTAEKWTEMTTVLTSPGSHNERIHIFAADDIKKVCSQSLDSDEILVFEKVPFEKAVQDIMDGVIVDAKTIAGIFFMKHLRQY